MEEDDPYIGREQTLVKHFILRKYLSRFAPIVLSNWNSISYVDCFSGPWNAHTDDLRDTSFSIALEELRRARDHHADSRRQVGLRCFFLERDADAYARLKAYADAVNDAEVETRNAILEESVDAILDFVRREGRQTFPFIFIDPTGWTGFAMDTIAPLLSVEPGEVLINLMTKDVRRFIESPEQQTQASFDRLFGRPGVKEQVAGLQAWIGTTLSLTSTRVAFVSSVDSGTCAPPSSCTRAQQDAFSSDLCDETPQRCRGIQGSGTEGHGGPGSGTGEGPGPQQA